MVFNFWNVDFISPFYIWWQTFNRYDHKTTRNTQESFELNCVWSGYFFFYLFSFEAVKCLIRVVIHLKSHKNSFYTTFPIKWMQFIFLLFTLKHFMRHIHKVYIYRPATVWKRKMLQSISYCTYEYAKRKQNKNPKIWLLEFNKKKSSTETTT